METFLKFLNKILYVLVLRLAIFITQQNFVFQVNFAIFVGLFCYFSLTLQKYYLALYYKLRFPAEEGDRMDPLSFVDVLGYIIPSHMCLVPFRDLSAFFNAMDEIILRNATDSEKDSYYFKKKLRKAMLVTAILLLIL